MAANWFIYQGNSTYGPYNWDELCRRGKEGLITPADMVKSEQMPEWVKASELPGLTITYPGQEGFADQETGAISGKNITA